MCAYVFGDVSVKCLSWADYTQPVFVDAFVKHCIQAYSINLDSRQRIMCYCIMFNRNFHRQSQDAVSSIAACVQFFSVVYELTKKKGKRHLLACKRMSTD